MAKNYYSAQPFIAWCLNHYFYSAQHYAWVGAPFYPYKLNNPTSSNPLRLYQDIYEPWKDLDPYSKIIAQIRLDLRKGVIANRSNLPLGISERRLKRVCAKIDVVFFYPMVYQVNVDAIAPTSRLQVKGSGALVGSKEYLIPDLQEAEFDRLFLDIDDEPAVQNDTDITQLLGGVQPQSALQIMEGRLV